jgi:deoxyadenosine/deoxycytidine kinase
VLPVLRYWPHLVVYLDAPVNVCLDRIKQRGQINEIACVDEKYLGVMADSYKDALNELRQGFSTPLNSSIFFQGALQDSRI